MVGKVLYLVMLKRFTGNLAPRPWWKHRWNAGLALALLVVTLGAQADDVSYEFDGTFGDHFVDINDEVGSLQQADGQLQYHNNNRSDLGSVVEVIGHASFTPGYTQSWTVSVEVSVPIFYDTNLVVSAQQDQWLAAGLVVVTDLDGDAKTFSAAMELSHGTGVGANLEREYVSEYFFGEIEPVGPVAVPTTEITGVVTISFDADTKVLVAVAATSLFSIDIDQLGPTNWGMTDEDVFVIGLFGSSSYAPVPVATPLTFDNFAGHVFDQSSVPGDANGDSVVDADDLGTLGFNFDPGVSGKTREQGDVSADGVVDLSDFGIVAFNFSPETSPGTSPVSTSVPEPGLSGLLGLSLALMTRRRGDRR